MFLSYNPEGQLHERVRNCHRKYKRVVTELTEESQKRLNIQKKKNSKILSEKDDGVRICLKAIFFIIRYECYILLPCVCLLHILTTMLRWEFFATLMQLCVCVTDTASIMYAAHTPPLYMGQCHMQARTAPAAMCTHRHTKAK